MDPKTLSDLVIAIRQAEVRISNFELGLRQGPDHHQPRRPRRPIRNELSDSITALIGLKEALTSENKAIRYIWTALFITAIGATMFNLYQTASDFLAYPIATNVELTSNLDYAFPTLVMCPGVWFDADKARRLGLSIEALKYSVSYLENWFVRKIEDVDKAKEEFLTVYKARNFSSVFEYYTAISTNLYPRNDSNDKGSWYYCPGCTMSRMAEQTILDRRLCYVFNVRSIERGLGMYAESRSLTIRYQERTAGLLRDLIDWELYFAERLDVFVSTHPLVTVRAFHSNFIKINIQRFKSLSRPDAPCHDNTDDAAYSAVRCMTECHNEMYRRRLGCGHIYLTQSVQNMTPGAICNRAERYPPENWTIPEFFMSADNAAIDAAAADICVRRCPRKCDKTLYETILQTQQHNVESETEPALRQANISVLKVHLKHKNAYQGGMVVSTDVYTYSSTQLVNNIGGALGLFLGGTLLTVAQLLLFFVSYALGGRSTGSQC